MTQRVTAPSGPKYPDVTVSLAGTKDNSMAVIGRVKRELQRQVGWDEAEDFVRDALAYGSYNGLIMFVYETVEVA